MTYADTDFFLGLADNRDRLHERAMSVYQMHRGSISTSIAVIIELALVSVRDGKSVEKIVSSALSIARLEDSSRDRALLAAHLIDKEMVGVFDAFHAAGCNGRIISSDHIYDRLGIERIKI